jgi:pyrrolidone-carboxylate peptidase
MSVDGIRKQLTQARRGDGKVDAKELDKIMLKVRDSGGLDATERAELVKVADSFDDATRQRLLRHLSSMGQGNAWVNLAAEGQVSKVEGRYATVSTGVRGLTSRVGLFDSTFALEGKAKTDGTFKLSIEGKELSVPVKRGDNAATVLGKLQGQLSPEVKSVLLSGSVQPFEMASFHGMDAKPDEKNAHLMLYKPAALGLLPGEKPMRVVVTGYGAFMGITDNPSANMAQKLAEQGIQGAVVEYRRIEVNHDAVQAFIAEMKKSPPDVILSMGVSSHSQVEERPENKVGGGVDGDNKPITPGVVRQGGKDELKTDLPVDAINKALDPFGAARVVGSSKSDPYYQPDRSAYLCNYMGYNLADSFGTSARTTAGFIHITESTPQDQMHAVLEAIAARQAEVRRTLPPVS